MKIKDLLREQQEIGKDGYKTRVQNAPDGIDILEETDIVDLSEDLEKEIKDEE